MSVKTRLYDAVIRSVGAFLPEKVITNDDLTALIDTSDEWVFSRTGIKERHVVKENQYTSDLALEAAKIALQRANLSANEIDLIIVATTTPDLTLPATAVKVQAGLNMTRGAAFDLQAVCAGFIYALTVASNFIWAGNAKNILVIGAETMSKIVDWKDRSTCILFGDGAGAVVLSAEEAKNNASSGVIDTHICSDGNLEKILYTDGGISYNQKSGVIVMQGKEVYRHAVEKMAESMMVLLERNNLTTSDISFLVPHQANIRIIEALAKRLDFPMEKVVVTLEKQANTSAATIPLALNSLYEKNKIKKGDIILSTALGGGLAWGSSLIVW